MYNIRDYGQMVSDQGRIQAYARALQRSVGTDSVVLDLGAGTGILSLLACRFGARRVFAVEPADSIEVAREIARANGLDSRIEFLQALSTDIDLPEPADVIVCDLRGMLPLFQHSVKTIIDARRRHLAPGGTLIPAVDVLRAMPVAAAEQYGALTCAWQQQTHGFDFAPANRLVLNAFYRWNGCAGDAVAPALTLATLDYPTVRELALDARASFVAARDVLAHGWAVWFESILADGVELSNAPGMPPLIYGQAFFPWHEPVKVHAGDRLALRLRAHDVGDNYLWAWETELPGRRFLQSEMEGEPISPGSLRRQAASHVPALGLEGRIDRLALDLMSRGASLGEIATALAQEFPQRFARWEAALTRAAELSTRYGH